MSGVISIPLGGKYAKGEHSFALVDADCAHLVRGRAWKAKPNGGHNHIYAVRTEKGSDGVTRDIRMHRVILGLGPFDGNDVDHINHNALDNRKCNLRVVSRAENCRNGKPTVTARSCKVCGTHFVRSTVRAVAHLVVLCAPCAKKYNARLPTNCPVYFPYCNACGRRFTSQASDHRFCSDRCRSMFKSKGRRPRINKRGSLSSMPTAARNERENSLDLKRP